MEFMLKIEIPKSVKQIAHQQKILSIGSCFTEHIGNALKEVKFDLLQNPHGILFDPLAVCTSLISYIDNKQYGEEDLFFLNELWHSWDHHSRFSHTDRSTTLHKINESQGQAHQFLKEADWLIITFGSAFSYKLKEQTFSSDPSTYPIDGNKKSVANCHRAPAQWFTKHLSTIDEIVARLDNTIHQLFRFNPHLNIIFTISPVRHIRDGVVDNNRSKARLIESVHHLIHKFNNLYYFPSYELIIDVLRDYRFYDVDMVHPNYSATEFVLKKFMETYMNEDTIKLVLELKQIAIARKHRTSHPGTEAHKQFLAAHYQKTKTIQERFPYLNLEEELTYFSQST
ncbi:MAG: GSCFA domain-containing protein [Flavisolibacter sp.]|nr:GSCFA domain-containing protein [Flavisolibacter sp.]